MTTLLDRVRNLITKGNNKMGTSYDNLTSVVNSLIGGYKETSWVDLGTGQSFNVKAICQQYGIDYRTLTANNFAILSADSLSQSYSSGASSIYSSCSLNKSYNASTGVLSANIYLYDNGSYGKNGNVHALLLLTK